VKHTFRAAATAKGSTANYYGYGQTPRKATKDVRNVIARSGRTVATLAVEEWRHGEYVPYQPKPRVRRRKPVTDLLDVSRAKVAEWEKKHKLATTKLKAWRTRRDYLERRAADLAKQEAEHRRIQNRRAISLGSDE
jgi:hypothetical protein